MTDPISDMTKHRQIDVPKTGAEANVPTNKPPPMTYDMSAWEEKIFPLPRGGRSPCAVGRIRLTPEEQAEDDRLERETTELMLAREMQAKLRNESPK